MLQRLVVFSLILASAAAEAGWNIDFTRRNKERANQDLKNGQPVEESKSLIDSVFTSSEPLQEIVVLNTDQGFIPSTVRTKVGGHYKIHLVNVNEKEKNVSFVLDAFSEHHSTYFGKIKSIEITPKKDGIFSFQCPETSAQGRLIVYPDLNNKSAQPEVETRAPANVE